MPALAAPPSARDNPFTRSIPGVIGLAFLSVMLIACLGTLPWTLGRVPVSGGAEGVETAVSRRYEAGEPRAGRLPPSWAVWSIGPEERSRLNRLVSPEALGEVAAAHGVSPTEALDATEGPVADALREHWPAYALGTDVLGRSLLVRSLAGGGISLLIGIAAATLSVLIGTLYGALSAYAGGRTDAVMMRIVDILYGLPYILLVVLLAVASDAALDNYISRRAERQSWVEAAAAQAALERGLPADAAESLLAEDEALRATLEERAAAQIPARQVTAFQQSVFDVVVLLIAIGGVSWLTMARVVRGQVLSLKSQPFMEAARAMGVPWQGQFFRHLLPNVIGPIIVYATLTVPQAILQESFLSFLGIGVKPPLPSWGNLAAEGLVELNVYKSHWWMLVFPCILLGSTLLALNFVGEGLREAVDPRRARR